MNGRGGCLVKQSGGSTNQTEHEIFKTMKEEVGEPW